MLKARLSKSLSKTEPTATHLPPSASLLGSVGTLEGNTTHGRQRHRVHQAALPYCVAGRDLGRHCPGQPSHFRGTAACAERPQRGGHGEESFPLTNRAGPCPRPGSLPSWSDARWPCWPREPPTTTVALPPAGGSQLRRLSLANWGHDPPCSSWRRPPPAAALAQNNTLRQVE